MRYFFLAYAIIALLVVGIFGIRGQKFSQPPVRIFPDMDVAETEARLASGKPGYLRRRILPEAGRCHRRLKYRHIAAHRPASSSRRA